MVGRNNAIDIFKLLASLSVVFIHAGLFNEVSFRPSVEVFKIMARWAIPFFFLVSGYMIGVSSNDDKKRVNKLISIFIYASLSYTPVIFSYYDYDHARIIKHLFSQSFLCNGAWFHLWFIPSLILGNMSLSYFLKNESLKVAVILGICLYLGCWFTDVLRSFDVKTQYASAFYLLRTTLSFPILLLGYICGTTGLLNKLKNKTSAVIIASGVLLSVAEVFFLNAVFGASILERQLPFFSILIAFGILSFCVNISFKETLLTKVSRECNLGVYIFHPAFLYFTGIGFEHFGVYASTGKFILSFVGSIILIYALKNYCRPIYNKINGVGVA